MDRTYSAAVGPRPEKIARYQSHDGGEGAIEIHDPHTDEVVVRIAISGRSERQVAQIMDEVWSGLRQRYILERNW